MQCPKREMHYLAALTLIFKYKHRSTCDTHYYVFLFIVSGDLNIPFLKISCALDNSSASGWQSPYSLRNL